MCRCKGCDTLLSTKDLAVKAKISSNQEDLCTDCRHSTYSSGPMHDYVHGSETESILATIGRDGFLTPVELPNDQEIIDEQ